MISSVMKAYATVVMWMRWVLLCLIIYFILKLFIFFYWQIIQNAPWTYSDEFINSNKIDFVAHDDIPYAMDGMDDIYGPLKAKGMFVATERTEGELNFICSGENSKTIKFFVK